MSECKQCERAVRQEGEGAMCFNCYLEKTTPLPTAEEIENDDYSTYQVAKMAKRIAELKAELAELNAAVDIYMDEAWHHEACPSYAGNTYTQCTCGYSALQEKGE